MFKKSSHVLQALMPLAALVSVGVHAAGFDALSSFNDPASINAPVYAGVALSNLNVTLVDLDPDDGVAPAMVYRPLGYSGSLYSDGMQMLGANAAYGPSCCDVNALIQPSGLGSSPWMPAETLIVKSTDGASVALAGPHDLAVASRLTYQDLLLENPTPDYLSEGTKARAMTTAEVMESAVPISLSDDLYWYFEVTPNTKVIFAGAGEGLARASTALGGFDASRSYFSATAQARVDVGVFLPSATSSDAQSAGYVWQQGERWDLSVYAHKNHFRPPTEATVTNASDFNLTFTNAGDGFKRGYFRMFLESHVDGTGVLSVPEPSTYALMGLGLIGISLAARRRQPLQA